MLREKSKNTEKTESKETTLGEETKKEEGWGKPLAKKKNTDQNNNHSSKRNTLVVSVSKQQNYNVSNSNSQTALPFNNEEEKCGYAVQQIRYDKVAQEDKVKINKLTMFNQKDIYKSIPLSQKNDAELREEIGSKLICSVTKLDIFDPSQPVLGYIVYLDRDAFGRIWPLCSSEMFSYEAYTYSVAKINSNSATSYRYWLPVYINQDHFERSKQYILNTIAMISTGSKDAKNNQFEPAMILKVLPAILVHTIVDFLQKTIAQSVAALEIYCHVYQLLVRLIEMFPELRITIDKEVESFCLKEENRHKKQVGDLGEFVVKLALSSKGLNDPEVNNLLLRESLARRASWAIKKDNELKFFQECPNLTERFMKATKVANQLFLIQLEAAKLLLDDSIKVELEERFGLLDGGKMKIFLRRLEWIQKNIVDDWKLYVEGIGQQAYVCNDQIMTAYIKKAFNMAKNKGYLN